MANFRVQGADGKMYRVEAPSAEAAAAAIEEMLSAQSAESPEFQRARGMVEDVARGAMAGGLNLAAGVSDIVQAPSRLGTLGLAKAGQKYAEMFGADVPQWTQSPYEQRVSGREMMEQGSITGPAMGYQPQTGMGSLAKTTTEMAPGYFLTPGGAAAKTAYGVLAPAVGAEAGERAAEALEFGETGQTVGRIAGSILGPTALGGLQRLVSPYGGVSQQRLERVKLLEEQGIPLKSGQVVGDPGLQMLEDSLMASPEQLRSFTNAVVKSFGGQPGDDIGRLLRTQQSRIGDKFDDVTSKLRVDPTSTSPASNPTEIVSRLQDIATVWGRGVQAGARINLIDDFVKYFDEALSGGRQITPKELLRFRSQLSRTSATTTDDATKQAAVALVRELDGVIDASLRGAGQADLIPELNTARRQWRDYLAFETAATRAGEAGLENTVSPQALAQALRQQGGTQYVAGERGLFGDIARAGEQVLRTAPAVGPGNVRSVPEVAAGQTAETAATIGGGGALSAIMAMMARMARPTQRAMAQDPLGQAYLRNQLLGQPDYLPLSTRMAVYGPLASMGGSQ